MDIEDLRIQYVAKQTKILRPPKQNLYAFGTTNVYYYLVTEPAYSELIDDTTETVIREGRVIAQRPRIVTPYYLTNLDGFSSEAKRYFESLLEEHGASVQGLYYTYKNEPEELNIVSDTMAAVVDKLNAEIDKRGDPLAAIIKGTDELWDVSLMKFIYELTRHSAPDNIRQLNRRGLFKTDARGIPADARLRIEELFQRVIGGRLEPKQLKDELDRWGVFSEYEDRFLNLFKKRQ